MFVVFAATVQSVAKRNWSPLLFALAAAALMIALIAISGAGIQRHRRCTHRSRSSGHAIPHRADHVRDADERRGRRDRLDSGSADTSMNIATWSAPPKAGSISGTGVDGDHPHIAAAAGGARCVVADGRRRPRPTPPASHHVHGVSLHRIRRVLCRTRRHRLCLRRVCVRRHSRDPADHSVPELLRAGRS